MPDKENKKSLISMVVPPPGWKIPVIVLLAVFTGIGITAFYISNAASYLSDDPEACVNCHVMVPQYATWFHSSHRERATCNDCHVPHDNFFRQYYFKASDGLRHATYFTFGWEPQVIRIHAAGKSVVQENCIRCHTHTVNPVSSGNVTLENFKHGAGHLCWDCHREVPHGKISSLASTPNARVPSLDPVLPDWLKKFTDEKRKDNINLNNE